ncbi:alpha-ketoacid dehydrogenase subunit beta [Amycolatopsis pithecellobii]|uniref:Alpha-ketoacid dehydrogenase subunit beta n=1 Tax=Amycolatopsis pithecellobii TaxID=664692 RepID=A0A6N7Z7D2_9PSEU|nr:alpha-ketoacid dehydrogenase subunit beta [Amycolatopsis pithecellobii]MTD57054.1 alpha-ketoacid dehydrogenase subunit beta [Amycolatopsis pithecellobii]
MTVRKYWQAVNDALREELARDERVVIFGEDVAKPGGPFGATRGLREEFGASRVRDTPISEAGIVGAAVGAAMTGLRPIAEIMYFDFITLAMDQLVNQAAKVRYMSGGALSVPMVVRVFCGAGRGSGPQHSQSVESWLGHVPGLRVVAPGDPAEAKALLKGAIRSPDPVIVLDSSRLWTKRGEVPDGDVVAPIGEARIVRPGNDVTIVAWSWALSRSLEAAEKLAAQGISAEVVDPRSLNPLDEKSIMDSLRRTGRLLIVHDAVSTYGPGAEIAALAAGPGFGALRAPVVRLTPPFAPAPFPSHLEQAYYPQPADIETAALSLVRG